LAHLGVARANALQARTSQGADADASHVRALAAYEDFLILSKDADSDIPSDVVIAELVSYLPGVCGRAVTPSCLLGAI
jgi:hypothetical protein